MVKEFSDLVEQHNSLSAALNDLPEAERIERASALLVELKKAGERIGDPLQREWLASAARNWGRYLYETTGEFYSVGLSPYKGLRKLPYKFLQSFEEQDVDIFFGRDHDIDRAIEKLLSSKLMILFGGGGVGKTSLIRAGIIPRLISDDYLPVYTRCTSEDPLVSIKTNTVDRLLQLSKTSLTLDNVKRLLATDLSLPDFIREIRELEARPLVVFIDQFEQFFISLDDATRKRFERELAECLDSPYIDARFVLTLREDFLAELNELDSLSNIYENRYRLMALAEEEAVQAIVRPAEKAGVTYEKGLADLIIRELSESGRVYPPQLQIVCDSLYNRLPKQETQISLALYEKLGGVRQFLADYVDTILDGLGPKRRSVARKLLRAMVTSFATMAPLSYSDAILETSDIPGWSELDTKDLLGDLVRARLVRKVAAVEEESYELTHEYLINKIQGWIDLEALKVKEAQDLLRQECNSWERHGIPMDRSSLEIVDAQRERLILNNRSTAFVLAAAVRYDFKFDYWLDRNQGNQQAIDLLTSLLREGEPSAKRLAGVALGNLTDDQAILKEIYSVYESVASPNTVKRIEELQSQGVCFAEGFLKKVGQVVEHRFTKNMVFVEAGEFIMHTSAENIESVRRKAHEEGRPISEEWFHGQFPQQSVYVDGFYIDKYLVTNIQFQEFDPSHSFPEGHEHHPVTNVSWYQAQEYARWIGKELPPEEEWEKAARGTQGFEFPWGNEWAPSRCNTRLSGVGGTTPVGQYKNGVGPYGCYDMAGNVWEWTIGLWEGRESSSRTEPYRAVRGGSWSLLGLLPWCWYRFHYEPEIGHSNVGFRCVRRVRSSDNGLSSESDSLNSTDDLADEE